MTTHPSDLGYIPDTQRLHLDVLQDIGRLEEYVGQSAVLLLFLSRGYFTSRNCLREIRAAEALRKPLVLLHEFSVARGGLSLEESKRECPEVLRPCVFGGRSVVFVRCTCVEAERLFVTTLAGHRSAIPWHRIAEFQRYSLKAPSPSAASFPQHRPPRTTSAEGSI